MSKLPNINTHFADWYQEVIYQAELADQSPVRGCIVIRPYGNDIWELIHSILDDKIKKTGHRNALFPLLIPKSFLDKEADHIEGFAPELAIVTHAGGKELTDPLVVRPTSETIIHYMFAQWIKSYRDLPLKINQWANVVRWEMRPRAFVRTSEFFWQEGHTAHATYDEAHQEALLMLEQYRDLAENYLAIPVIIGRKSEGEKFPGAEITYTFEGFMPDGKALQMGTSHMLSQSFAHAFEMKFQTKDGSIAYPFLTSWGATTRLIGALIMVHGDEKGLNLPPRIAPIQIVIIPIYKTETEKLSVYKIIENITQKLQNENMRVFIDNDEEKTPGNKFYYWELRGVPVRIEIGPRDIMNNTIMIVNRLTGDKSTILVIDAINIIKNLLQTIQNQLFERARSRRDNAMKSVESLSELINYSETNILQSGFCGDRICEAKLKEHKLSIRCLLKTITMRICFACQSESKSDAIIARSY